MDEDDENYELLLLQLMFYDIEFLVEVSDSLLSAHIWEQPRLNRSLPIEKQRVPWSHFSSRISDVHFRDECFEWTGTLSPCSVIEFASRLVKNFFVGRVCQDNERSRTKSGPKKSKWGSQVAFSIRLLAGGSYLDLAPLFHVSTTHLYNVFHQFVDQVLQEFDFLLVGWLRQRNWGALEALANAFAEKTYCVFYGPFAAIDGLAVRIRLDRRH